MQAMWVSLKENINCRRKLTDVAGWPHRYSKERSFNSGKENLEVELHQAGNPVKKVLLRPNHPRRNEVELQQTGNPVREVLFRPNFPRAQLYRISIGDQSRNIIETIFKKALKDPSKPSRKIKRVLKVKNSVETLERFEKYREKVKKKAYDECEQCKRHPRSSVDGNELLRFYGTVMTCGERPAQVSELCRDPFCRVCRTIQSNFDTQHLRKNGIRLSTNSEELCDTMVALTKKVKRAVIVCRTIAGRVGHMVDDGAFEECDSFTSGLHSNIGDLIVKTPSAVLPCFVVVFT